MLRLAVGGLRGWSGGRHLRSLHHLALHDRLPQHRSQRAPGRWRERTLELEDLDLQHVPGVLAPIVLLLLLELERRTCLPKLSGIQRSLSCLEKRIKVALGLEPQATLELGPPERLAEFARLDHPIVTLGSRLYQGEPFDLGTLTQGIDSNVPTNLITLLFKLPGELGKASRLLQGLLRTHLGSLAPALPLGSLKHPVFVWTRKPRKPRRRLRCASVNLLALDSWGKT